MIESKNDKVNIYIQPTTYLGDVAVGVCFKASLNACVLGALNGLCNCTCLPPGSEEACAAYALYLAVADKLCGNPLAAKNSKVGRVDVGYHNGCLVFTWKMKGTVSHVRKALGMAVSALKPGSLYSLYGHCMRRLNGKVKKEHFNDAAKKLLAGINQGVVCCVIGKIKLGKTNADAKTKVDDMAQKINNKLSPGKIGTPQAENKEHGSCDHSSLTELKVSGWQAYVVKDYIKSKARGVEPLMTNNSVLVPMKESSYNSLKKRIKKQVGVFVNQKYSKLGSECGPVLAYLALASSSLSCTDAKKLCGVKSSDIVSALNSNL